MVTQVEVGRMWKVVLNTSQEMVSVSATVSTSPNFQESLGAVDILTTSLLNIHWMFRGEG